MNLQLFFEPVDQHIYEPINGVNTIAEAIRIYGREDFDWKEAKVVFFSCSHDPEGEANRGFDAARAAFYQFKKGTNPLYMADLGYLKPGPTEEDTNSRLQEVVNTFVEMGIIPVILGQSHVLTYGQFLAYEAVEKPISIAVIDSFFDIENFEDSINDENHLQHIITHKPNYLVSYAHLAYQSYLVDHDILRIFEKLNFEKYRLGALRDSTEEMEPVLRMADMVSFDLAALKKSVAPSAQKAQPFGLTGEEACQLAWYCGTSDSLSSLGIFGIKADDNLDEDTAYVIATMLWYFVEGYTHRNDDMNFEGMNYTRFVVSFNDAPHRLTFYKSKMTGKWWMNITEQQTIPCSYEDYQIAASGEIPDRWIRATANFS